ncbi:MAG: family transcriptional regulator, anaerobic regulatory protein [Tenuifilum sp.]|jgi:CRP/FNR family transcriptional regulator|uniref:Crp/Fnr family transcriptional regulator n=1 Tax=Tenuifilum sp. TaxID=2760880 RepID=UPI0024AAE848|nr:Crp/Fnr family transcriptional regulator [Tenuifilum sp.]MDI3525872.1 family transcriptional regulator, anaerobic regulatory protein [Tenuifilum sp.]
MNKDICPGSKCSECGFRSSVFARLSDDQLDSLTASKTFAFAKKGEVIAKQGEGVKGFIFLRKGLAKLTRENPDGREQIIGIATPNDFVGLLSIFSSKKYQYNIIAIEDCEYCCVDYDMVMDLVSTNGDFAKTLLEKISQVSDLMMGTRLDLELRQLRGRVAFILCYFANEVYKSQKFNLPISRREIAELIDMRVENVVRILSELRRDNVIKIEGTTIEIVNPEKLRWMKEHG